MSNSDFIVSKLFAGTGKIDISSDNSFPTSDKTTCIIFEVSDTQPFELVTMVK